MTVGDAVVFTRVDFLHLTVLIDEGTRRRGEREKYLVTFGILRDNYSLFLYLIKVLTHWFVKNLPF